MTGNSAPIQAIHRDPANKHLATSERAIPRRLCFERVDPTTLSERERATLYTEIQDVMLAAACRIQSNEAEKSWIEEVIDARRKDTTSGYNFILIRDHGKLVGVFGYKIFDLCERRCLEMVSGYLLPSYQKYGIGLAVSTRLLFSALASRPGRGILVLIEVMNPIVVAGWRQRIPKPEAMYPSLGGAKVNPTLLRVSQEYMSSRSDYSSFDPDTGIIHGAHLGRTGQRDVCSDKVVSEFFQANVDHAAGDTLLMIIDGSRSNLLHAAGQLVRAIPRSILRSIRMSD